LRLPASAADVLSKLEKDVRAIRDASRLIFQIVKTIWPSILGSEVPLDRPYSHTYRLWVDDTSSPGRRRRGFRNGGLDFSDLPNKPE
jgi:hypothetical protein